MPTPFTSIDTCAVTIGHTTKHMVNFTYPEAGSYIMSTTRLVVFSFFFLINWYNRRLLEREGFGLTTRSRTRIILPSYTEYMYLLTGMNLFFGLIDLIISNTPALAGNKVLNLILMPIEMASFSCLYQGLAVFLMMMGAGYKAFKRAFRYGLLFSFLTIFLFVFEIGLYQNQFKFFTGSESDRHSAVFFMIISYWLFILTFYLVLLYVPLEILYCYRQIPSRRPALIFYARCSALYYLSFIVMTSFMQFYNAHGLQKSPAACGISTIALISMTMLQPYIIFRTLQIDSLYWQGIAAGIGGENDNVVNPLSDVWDQVDMETADKFGEILGKIDRKSTKYSKFLHFGLFDLEKRLGFVAGGFSRVYFAKYSGQKVALKIVFHMELTPHDCQEFLKEAEILHTLRHKNVVNTLGISVMPPVMALVLEYCKYGSLFDFLHKKVKINHSVTNDDEGWRQSTGSVIRLTETMRDSNWSATSGNQLVANNLPARMNTGVSTGLEFDRGSDTSTIHRSEVPPDRGSLSAAISTVSTLFSQTYRGSILHPDQFSSPHGHQLPMSIRLKLLGDVTRGVAHLHSKLYMHCDIKSLNFLVADNLVVKISDFGETRHINAAPKNPSMPPIPAFNWAPPEVLVNNADASVFTMRSDIYGLAIVLSEVLLAEAGVPYIDLEPDKMSKEKWWKYISNDDNRPHLHTAVPEKVRHVIQMCWKTDPLKRLTADFLLKVIEEAIEDTTHTVV